MLLGLQILACLAVVSCVVPSSAIQQQKFRQAMGLPKIQDSEQFKKSQSQQEDNSSSPIDTTRLQNLRSELIVFQTSDHLLASLDKQYQTTLISERFQQMSLEQLAEIIPEYHCYYVATRVKTNLRNTPNTMILILWLPSRAPPKQIERYELLLPYILEAVGLKHYFRATKISDLNTKEIEYWTKFHLN